jgi:hypothetical protein
MRSAKDVFTKGGHVTSIYRDQQFRLHFYKRVLYTSNSNTNIPMEEYLLDSSPVVSVKHCENLRFISKQAKVKQYSKYSNIRCDSSKYSKQEDLVVKNFLKGLLASPPMFNLNRDGLE